MSEQSESAAFNRFVCSSELNFKCTDESIIQICIRANQFHIQRTPIIAQMGLRRVFDFWLLPQVAVSDRGMKKLLLVLDDGVTICIEHQNSESPFFCHNSPLESVLRPRQLLLKIHNLFDLNRRKLRVHG
ncbi:MAG: hypothetical protein EBY09_05605 [Verrucomicrobia bacterium]|nr:hypothetical protein [Verrucomicrobiota bacterium]NBU10840.1 hypothetical protein [Pseudomonadota bacterium]NDA66107.1 hypothetical protein [Verrucomicrobiota bacterium]NDD37918.1 hypothetical protein [Verrucomicrobiota bacterium]NDE97749.1 hypothetical protein [Verrucomicrobiota bacterium]